jgi:ASCH domain-containing protein
VKALTIHQPWAGLIMAGIKGVENRKWRPNMAPGTRFAIHAGRDADVEEWVIEESQKRLTPQTAAFCLENGVILGTVLFMGIVTKAEELPPDQRKWFVGPVGWLLSEPHEWNLPPKIKGQLGLWDVPEDCGKLGVPGVIGTRRTAGREARNG